MNSKRHGRWAYLLVAAAVAMALGGCGSASASASPSSSASSPSATHAPTPKPTLAPTPSPTPVKSTLADFFMRCPTAAEIADVNSRLKVTFEGTPAVGTLSCTAADGSADMNIIQRRAYQTIIIMKYLQFSKPLPWTDKQLYDWFTVGSGITGIRFIYEKYNHDYDPNNPPTSSFCCSPAHVIDIYYSEINFLMMTSTWSNGRMGAGLSDITTLLIHEARHNLYGPHTCVNGDKTIAEMGASGVEYSFWVWIEKFSDRAFLTAPGDDPDMYLYSAQYNAARVRAANFCNEPAVPPITQYVPQPLPS